MKSVGKMSVTYGSLNEDGEEDSCSQPPMAISMDIENPSWALVRNGVHPTEFVFQKSRATARTHDPIYFFHNVFFCDNFTKTLEITPKLSEILVRGRKSQVSVEEIHISFHCQFEGVKGNNS